MKCQCNKKCRRKLKVWQDKEDPKNIMIKIGWFWRIVDKKELQDAIGRKDENNCK